jgi:lipoprotein-anchoring transpeptidase ErfK/SrfK
VKAEHEVKVSSRNPACQDSYKDWLVKIDKNGRAHLYGINDGKETESVCDSVLGWVFGVNESKFLKFPLSVGQTWTHRFERTTGKRTIRIEPQYKVAAWEKVQTPKGTFEAFKIVGAAEWATPRGDQNFNKWTEYYSPTVKAMVLSEIETVASKRKVMLVDFNMSN